MLGVEMAAIIAKYYPYRPTKEPSSRDRAGIKEPEEDTSGKNGAECRAQSF